MKNDITDRVVFMKAMEDRVGVRFEGVFAEISKQSGEYEVAVRGEVHATSGEALENRIDIVVSVYDDRGRVIATNNAYIDNESFFVFEVFDIICYGLTVNPEKIRLYPKVS